MGAKRSEEKSKSRSRTMIINFLIFLICVSLAEFLWDLIPYLTRIICLFYHKAIIHPLLHMIKFSFSTFASFEYLRSLFTRCKGHKQEVYHVLQWMNDTLAKR